MKCETCRGEKEIVRMLKKPYYAEPFGIYKDRERITCSDCKGTGEQPDKPDIDFIKWMCEKAEGFRYDGSGFISHSGWTFSGNSVRWESMYYPLLLQRAIEGVNRDQDKWRIIQTDSALRLYDSDSGFTIPECIYKFSKMSEDQAKELSLLYILEQEKNK